uniref:Uncharacterized protein n=1 Tax=Romanomermis culicivorax TaxID=13658 RepID=A0A915JTQ6_ROMCU
MNDRCRGNDIFNCNTDHPSMANQKMVKVDEKVAGSSWIWIAIVWIVFCSAFFAIAFSSNTNQQLFEELCYCHNVMIWTLKATVYVSTYSISIQKNRQLIEQFTLKSDQHNLNERFVMWSNINTTRWLIPINIFHCAISVALILSINIGRLIFHSVSDGYVIYITAFMNVYAFEVMAHPMVTIRLLVAVMTNNCSLRAHEYQKDFF